MMVNLEPGSAKLLYQAVQAIKTELEGLLGEESASLPDAVTFSELQKNLSELRKVANKCKTLVNDSIRTLDETARMVAKLKKSV